VISNTLSFHPSFLSKRGKCIKFSAALFKVIVGFTGFPHWPLAGDADLLFNAGASRTSAWSVFA
jgi:hypothetical protein